MFFKSELKIHDTHFIVVNSMATYLQQKTILVKFFNVINIYIQIWKCAEKNNKSY